MDDDDDEMYGLNSSDYSGHRHSFPQPPDHLLSSLNYHAVDSPAFGSDHIFGASSAFSDAPTMVSQLGRSASEEEEEEEVSSAIRAKVASHPLYPKLLEAFIDCQKVGAPPEMADLFDEICRENDQCLRSTPVSTADPDLDEFMETYCDILVKYKSDLEKPFNEATTFLNSIETQLSNLCSGASRRSYVSDETAGSSEDDFSAGETQVQDFHRTAEDRELKDKLFRKYSGYISSLKNEFSKTKKKGKLPREARQMLLDWWTVHYKWPYPTEADKVALAESTGLDQKQINNWFINQRKRHWRPSENMQFAVMDSLYGPFCISD
ncbi:hypothetical protein CsSME_00053208 [Camellia sinensis var. sinensis]